MVSAPNKARRDADGEKLIKGEQMKEMQIFFDNIIQQHRERATMLSGLFKQGDKIQLTEIK